MARKHRTEKGHACTKAEAREIKRIIWKYFDKEFARNALVLAEIRDGKHSELEIEKAHDAIHEDFSPDGIKKWKRWQRAAKEYFDYVDSHQIFDIYKMSLITEEERAIIYDSGMIYGSY